MHTLVVQQAAMQKNMLDFATALSPSCYEVIIINCCVNIARVDVVQDSIPA